LGNLVSLRFSKQFRQRIIKVLLSYDVKTIKDWAEGLHGKTNLFPLVSAIEAGSAAIGAEICPVLFLLLDPCNQPPKDNILNIQLPIQ